MRHVPLVVCISIIVAACGGAEAPPSSPPTPGATATAQPNQSPLGDGMTSAPVAFDDGENDLVDSDDGSRADRNPHIDLTRVEASANGMEVVISMTMAAVIPPDVSASEQELTYVVAIQADRSDDLLYWAFVGNDDSGDWYGGYTEFATGLSFDGASFPGVVDVSGSTVTMRLPLEWVGSPTTLRMMAVTQSADHATGDVHGEDQAPEGDQSVPADGWLTLGA